MKSLKVNDKVVVISGSLKGTEAKIVKIDRLNGKACLEGVRVIEKKIKPTQYNPRGGKKTVHLGIDLSNLKLVEASKFVSSKKADKKTDKKADKKVKKGAK